MHISRSGIAARLLGRRQLAQLELLAQLAQGKGWASTVAQEVDAVRQLLGGKADSPLVVLDVGANVGTWTRQALRSLPQAQIHAFEPSTAAADALRSAVGAEDRVSIHQLALSAETGDAILYTNAPGSTIASLTNRPMVGIEPSLNESVRTITLEEWAESAETETIDVLKLDVEGYELDVLRGSGDLLRGISVIQFEFGGCDVDTRTYFRDFWYFFTEAGKRIYRLGPTGLHDIDRYSARDEVFITTNYFVT